jgi:predicted transcriptional regulator
MAHQLVAEHQPLSVQTLMTAERNAWREITRKIDEQINSVRRELQNLLNIGIVRSVSQSNRLYYEVNPKYKFHKELQSIFQQIPAKSKEIKQTKEEDQIFKNIQKAGNVRMAFLTGAFVRGSNQQIDIFIVGDMNKSQLARIIADMEKDMNRELNYAAFTVEDYDYRRNLNDRFLTDILDENKIILCDKIGVFPNSKEAKEEAAAEQTEDETTKVSVQSEGTTSN